MEIYPAVSLVIGGRDGMDGGGGHWMTRSNYSTRHQSWAFLCSGGLLRAFGTRFGCGKVYSGSITLIITYSTILLSH
jgi:hypothetical protein